MRYNSSACDHKFSAFYAEIRTKTAICEEGTAGRYNSSVLSLTR
jgi:hypothetical protein